MYLLIIPVEHRNIETENDETRLNFEQFINMMTSNIAEFRKKYSDRVVFESGTICLYRNL
jgi:hypothetical protein